MNFSSVRHTITHGRLGWLGFPAKNSALTANFEEGKYLRDSKTALDSRSNKLSAIVIGGSVLF